jgi:hypothetical protein
MTTFGVTNEGFVLKRLADILTDFRSVLTALQDPITGEQLTLDLADENDPLVLLVNATDDALSVCWEQIQLANNQFDPLKATGAGLSGLVQLNGIIRKIDETDTQLRARQQLSTMTTASSLIESVFGAIMNLEGVTYCRVYQNLTLSTDGRNIPAKSIATVVQGGDEDEIAQVLWRKASAFPMYGGISVVINDLQGIPYTMKFIRPTEVPIFITIAVTVVDDIAWPDDGDDQIKAAILSFAATDTGYMGLISGVAPRGWTIGQYIYASELYIPVNSVGGINITSLKVGLTAAPTGYSAVIDWDELGIFTEENIAVTVTY